MDAARLGAIVALVLVGAMVELELASPLSSPSERAWRKMDLEGRNSMFDRFGFLLGSLLDRVGDMLCATVEFTPGRCTGFASVKGGRRLGAEHNAFFR